MIGYGRNADVSDGANEVGGGGDEKVGGRPRGGVADHHVAYGEDPVGRLVSQDEVPVDAVTADVGGTRGRGADRL